MNIPRRKIDLTFELGTGAWGDTVGDKVTFTGLRVHASVIAVGGASQGAASIRVFGLPLDVIQRLTSVGAVANTIRGANKVLIAAGDEGSALTTIYQGTIDSAYGDFNASPDVAFNVTALSALTAALKPVGARSYVGSTDVATIMAQLAEDAGFAFENHGVTATLASPYLPGAVYQQIQLVARAAGIYHTVDRNTLHIWPANGSRGGDIPLLSPDSGMVGYPAFSSVGLQVASVFMPTVALGGRVDVKSMLNVANGRWRVARVQHDLQSETPGGHWFTQLELYPDGQ